MFVPSRSALIALILLPFAVYPALAQSSGAPVGTTNVASVGTILVDQNGMTLYTFSADPPNTSTCTGACATAWPPASAASMASGGGAAMLQLGSITRTDGTTQLTWNGRPLYRFAGDQAPGQVNGNNSTAFGGTWAVVNPNSAPSSGTASSSSSSAPAAGTSNPPANGLLLNIDTPTAGASVSQNQLVDIGGWSSGSMVTVTLDSPSGQTLGQGAVDAPRPDVAQTLGRPDLANSGFNVTWDVTRVGGPHTLFVTAANAAGQTTTQQLQVTVAGGSGQGGSSYQSGSSYSGGFTPANPNGMGYPGMGYPGMGYPGSGYPGSGYPGTPYPGTGYPGGTSTGSPYTAPYSGMSNP